MKVSITASELETVAFALYLWYSRESIEQAKAKFPAVKGVWLEGAKAALSAIGIEVEE